MGTQDDAVDPEVMEMVDRCQQLEKDVLWSRGRLVALNTPWMRSEDDLEDIWEIEIDPLDTKTIWKPVKHGEDRSAAIDCHGSQMITFRMFIIRIFEHTEEVQNIRRRLEDDGHSELLPPPTIPLRPADSPSDSRRN